MSELCMEVLAETRVEGAGAGEGAGAEAKEKGAEDLGPLALALQVPGKMVVGSSRFQQFFF